MSQLMVKAPSGPYPIIIDRGLINLAEVFKPYIVFSTMLIVTDDHVAPLYLEPLKKTLSDYQVDTLILKHGEMNKTLDQWSLILDTLVEKRHQRQTTLIALGGGVVGDMTGFAAACYQRGVNWLQVPTTLLAQVDASVGGKTAVNHPEGKNLIGAFYQPKAVIIDTDTLATLPDREYHAGLAEVLKYSLIQDGKFFSFLQSNIAGLLKRDTVLLAKIILRCCEIKAGIVAEDEREEGIRAILNFGHTFGHAIEKVTNYQHFLHGEAIAVGMVLALKLGVRLKMHSKLLLDDTVDWLKACQLPTDIADNCQADALWQAMQFDKKRHDDQLRFILLDQLGHAVIRDDIHEAEIKAIFS